jgi:hypothetical protein
MDNNKYHLATKVVSLMKRLKIRFYSSLFIPYFTNKTTLVANRRILQHQTSLPYFQINT